MQQLHRYESFNKVRLTVAEQKAALPKGSFPRKRLARCLY